jgi:hypothetical protein
MATIVSNQTPRAYGDTASYEQTIPATIPVVPEALWTRNVELVELDLTIMAGVTSAVTVTVMDRQTVPVEAAVVELQPGSVAPITFGGRYCPNGLTWKASAASSVTGFAKVRLC